MAYGKVLRGLGLIIARFRAGFGEALGGIWRGSDYTKVQKIAKKLHFFTFFLAYIKKKQYLCSGFGNSPIHNLLI